MKGPNDTSNDSNGKRKVKKGVENVRIKIEKDDHYNQHFQSAALNRIGFICKCLAVFIIVLSATFHLYRLFRYGMFICTYNLF